ncbi:MAG: hypothetical protein H8E66_07730 [Planctomycetes bacterium]|nr:hypothetical protein [Planctomycetota bacterium]
MAPFIHSERTVHQHIFFVVALLSSFVVGSVAQAQSSTRTRRGTVNQIPQGSTNRAAATNTALGLNGYCPVCIVEMKKWVKGSPTIRATYDGTAYYFPSADQRDTFLADPAKYIPALGGDCTVCLAKMGKRVPGSIFHAAMSKKRLFLFPGKDQRQEFLDNASKYIDTDLAYGGNCVVCSVEMGKEVPGKPEFAAYHDGWRYLFPGKDQREMFLASPAKYVAPPARNTQSSTSSTNETLITVTGKSGCAACDHGVSPISSPNELGLAVKAADGKIYIVENAHQLYPKVYEDRFSGLRLSVAGTVVKQAGKISWISPKELKILN